MKINYVGAYWDQPYELFSFISIDETDPQNKRIVVTFRGSVGTLGNLDTNWRQDLDHRARSCFDNKQWSVMKYVDY